MDIEIEWQKEPESTTNKNKNGYLHYKGIADFDAFSCKKVIFELRFDYREGRDIWALEYLPDNRIWTRDGISASEVLFRLAEHFLNDPIKYSKEGLT